MIQLIGINCVKPEVTICIQEPEGCVGWTYSVQKNDPLWLPHIPRKGIQNILGDPNNYECSIPLAVHQVYMHHEKYNVNP